MREYMVYLPEEIETLITNPHIFRKLLFWNLVCVSLFWPSWIMFFAWKWLCQSKILFIESWEIVKVQRTFTVGSIKCPPFTRQYVLHNQTFKMYFKIYNQNTILVFGIWKVIFMDFYLTKNCQTVFCENLFLQL